MKPAGQGIMEAQRQERKKREKEGGSENEHFIAHRQLPHGWLDRRRMLGHKMVQTPQLLFHNTRWEVHNDEGNTSEEKKDEKKAP